MNKEILNRKGARKGKDIPKDVLKLLNEGKIETVNLTEWLAIDHSILIKNVFPEIRISNSIIDIVLNSIKKQKKPSTMNSVKLTGNLLFENQSDLDSSHKCNFLTHHACKLFFKRKRC